MLPLFFNHPEEDVEDTGNVFDPYVDNLNLTDEQKTISRWIDNIHAQNCAYTAVVFRMAMQHGFSILEQLTYLT